MVRKAGRPRFRMLRLLNEYLPLLSILKNIHVRFPRVLRLGCAQRSRYIPEVELDFARNFERVAETAIMNDEVFRLAVIPGARIHLQRFAAEIADIFVRELLPG